MHVDVYARDMGETSCLCLAIRYLVVSSCSLLLFLSRLFGGVPKGELYWSSFNEKGEGKCLFAVVVVMVKGEW